MTAEISRLIQARDWRQALLQVDQALGADPASAALLVARAQCLLGLGNPVEARRAAAAAEAMALAHPAHLDALGSVFSGAGDQPRALSLFDRAVALAPVNAHFIFNRATVYRFLGRLAEAEADYDRVIALKPDDYEAYLNRTELRTQTSAANHLDALESLASRGIADPRGFVQIHYALAKECEDLELYPKSFDYLKRGAAKRREHLRYEIAHDVATVDWIIDAFPGGVYPAGQGASEDAPIFIVGLPRSGSTLVERILSSHTNIVSAGELNDFALSLVAAVRRQGGAAQLPRRELVARCAAIDFAQLGSDYLARARRLVGGSRFIDKMPLNYLYCGLIRRALPNAKIVHVQRHPMAVCYAMYKTLFQDGYPFSYDLEEIARYYIAYRRLMDHWQATVPGALHTVHYEALVADQIGQTRLLLKFCDLEWQDACVEFERNTAASTTASAPQVRRPIYQSSVAQWRHYESELEPLMRKLRSAGIDTG